MHCGHQPPPSNNNYHITASKESYSVLNLEGVPKQPTKVPLDNSHCNSQIQKLKSMLGEDIKTVRHAVHSSPQQSVPYSAPVLSPIHGLTVEGQLGSKLIVMMKETNLTLHSKCDQIIATLGNLTGKELSEIFPQLLSEVFGFSGSNGWGLHILEPRYHSLDYMAAYRFLKPGGCLFEAIEKLLHNHEASFQFPVSCLPSAVVENIESNTIPPWYQEKLIMISGNKIGSGIALNALEYFLVLFAYYMVHPSIRKAQVQWSSVEDVLYIRLYEEYLNYFLPMDGSASQLAISPLKNVGVSPSNFTSPLETRKSSGFLSSTSMQKVASMASIYQVKSSTSESFLQIICDFWLGQDKGDDALSTTEEYFLPTVDHARVVRVLVKYLHLFVNACQPMGTFNNPNPQTDEFKSMFVPAMLQKKLYIFLKRCFTHWPLDGSFRMILETWLSYIQPWRYQEKNTSMSDDVEIDFTLWRSFISDNILFYSSLFQLFLPRAMRYDMMSVTDVQLIYRVAKVFSQPSLIELLQEEETIILTPASSLNRFRSQTHPAGASFIHVISSAHSLQLEKPGYSYQPLFTQEATRQVVNICQKLADNVIGLRHRILTSAQSSKGNDSGLLAKVKEFFMVEHKMDQDQERDEQRLIEYLERSCFLLTTMFKLPALQTMPAVVSPESSEELETADGDQHLPRPVLPLGSNENLPDCVITDNGIMLTDKGRYQIIQGIRQFDLLYSGDPEFQSIRSYECASVVRFMYQIATKINERYAERLEVLYNRKDIIGKTLKRCSKGVQTTHYVDTPIQLPQIAANEHIIPRISLRFVGSYYFLGYFCWIIILARLFGFGWISILFLMVSISLVCVVYNIDQPPRRLKKD